jgi:hypothetical protein
MRYILAFHGPRKYDEVKFPKMPLVDSDQVKIEAL